jgi:hypothetical protein
MRMELPNLLLGQLSEAALDQLLALALPPRGYAVLDVFHLALHLGLLLLKLVQFGPALRDELRVLLVSVQYHRLIHNRP